MAERRALAFASLDEVMPAVKRLLDGHTVVGRWTLAQILNHLALAVAYTAMAPPSATGPTSEEDVVRRRFFSGERYPDGVEVPSARLLPTPDLDARTEANALSRAIARSARRTDPCPAHPLLGPLTREEWDRFHCMHCAHHLGFVVATAESAG